MYVGFQVSKYLYLVYALPFVAFLTFLFFTFTEKQIKRITDLVILPSIFANCILLFSFLSQSYPYLNLQLFTLNLGHHHFGFSLFVDRLSLILLFLTSFLSYLVTRLSHTYLHRETGYQRFYRTIYLFISGMFLLSLAGNLDMFFAGWELVGFASFLLIAFYRDRTRPVKNAFRVYSIYRISDIGLLLTAILGHILTQDADHFEILASGQSLLAAEHHSGWLTVMGLFVVLASIGKSGQFPFINWPARAMEGPTPSSAIFYGALSIHCGVVLLLRTYEIWKDSFAVVFLITSIGLISLLFATLIGSIQSNIKGKIAYATVGHIGFMFIEVAQGFHTWVLLHIVFHSLLRCYQILISPSVVVESVKKLSQAYSFKSEVSLRALLPQKLISTLYCFSFQEGFLSNSERGFFLFPFLKWKLYFRKLISFKFLSTVLVLFILSNWFLLKFETHLCLAYIFAFLDIFISLHCLLSLKHPKYIWRNLLLAQLAFVLSIYLIDFHGTLGIMMYLLTILPCWLLGYFVLKDLEGLNMKIFNGYYVLNPSKAHLMFIVFIGFSGLPFTTVFWAEDLLLGQIFLVEPVILGLTTFSLMLNGLIVARILTKSFWGFPTQTEF